MICPPGMYTVTAQNSVCLACPATYYCTTGSDPQPCPAGFYCAEGTGYDYLPCPAGTFSDSIGMHVYVCLCLVLGEHYTHVYTICVRVCVCYRIIIGERMYSVYWWFLL